jgi:hypothetical protein
MTLLIWIEACCRFQRTPPSPGSGRVDIRIVLWEDDEVLKLPLTLLSRDSEHWTVFVEECGRACLCHLSLCCHFARSWVAHKRCFQITPSLSM